MVETAHNREDLAIEKRDFSYDLAKHALQLTLIYPVDPEKRRGIVLPQVPGVAAARRVYEPTGIALAQRGYTSLLMRHDGAGEEGIKQVRYALELASDGELDDIISDGDDIIPDGHSLGTRKVVRSLELMMRNNDDIRIKRALFSAAACLGGVHGWNAPFRTARSITAEIRYMGTIHALRQRRVAAEGLEYIKERVGAPPDDQI